VKLFAFLLLVCLSVPAALAQDRERGTGRQGGQGAGQQDRQQPRDQAQAAKGHRAGRPDRMRPEERDKLRRDIEDANRQMERRR
jgi:hypothetical protein